MQSYTIKIVYGMYVGCFSGIFYAHVKNIDIIVQAHVMPEKLLKLLFI